jgi:hypothetical protein
MPGDRQVWRAYEGYTGQLWYSTSVGEVRPCSHGRLVEETRPELVSEPMFEVGRAAPRVSRIGGSSWRRSGQCRESEVLPNAPGKASWSRSPGGESRPSKFRWPDINDRSATRWLRAANRRLPITLAAARRRDIGDVVCPGRVSAYQHEMRLAELLGRGGPLRCRAVMPRRAANANEGNTGEGLCYLHFRTPRQSPRSRCFCMLGAPRAWRFFRSGGTARGGFVTNGVEFYCKRLHLAWRKAERASPDRLFNFSAVRRIKGLSARW